MDRAPTEATTPEPEPAAAPDGGPTDLVCTSCGEPAPPGSTWCEACGHELAVAATDPCTACGERVVSPEGYCLSCGQRQPRERDHVRLTDGPIAAVSDRGRRHHHNEDAAAIAMTDGGAVLVVCDGVSSTPGSAEASSRAAAEACAELVERAGHDSPGDRSDALVHAVERAQRAAAGAVEAVESSDGDDGVAVAEALDLVDPPSSTLVAVLARPRADGTEVDLATAWVGDSRAYWVGPDGGRRLTGDDHEIDGSLTRWLGADSVDPSPGLANETVTGPGHLVVCSDGLWRYAAEPDDMAELVNHYAGEGLIGLDLAEALVGHANHNGGHDNISVALWSNISAAHRSSTSSGSGGAEATGEKPAMGEQDR